MTGLITQFLGAGLAASRPATPDVPTGALAFYFATDTEVLSFYDPNDAAWQTAGGGALADGDYGDITVSSSGTVFTIDNGSVTLAKQANMATASVVYRKTAGSGAPEVQTLATLKTDLGLTGTNSGDQIVTLTGDVTGSGTGSFAATIANDAVTYAKMQNVSAASKLLGRGSASGSGDAEEITLGSGLSMSGTTLSASASSTRPSVVQVASGIGNTYAVTMGSTPTPGNLLVAMGTHWSSNPTANTGWTSVFNDNGSSVDGTHMAVKVATSADTTSQTPFAGTNSGSATVIFEIQDGFPVLPIYVPRVDEVTVSPYAVSMVGTRNNGLCIGMVSRGGNNGSFSVGGGFTTDLDNTGTSTNNTPRRVQGIHLDVDKGTSASVSATFSGGNIGGILVEIYAL